MGKDKLAECRVERETVDTIARGEDKVGRRAVPRGMQSNLGPPIET
jgi:hypothetical protein